MKISLTKREYRALLDMLYLADWMMQAEKDDDDDSCTEHPEHKALRKKILSHYKEMGAEDIIKYDQQSDEFFETRDYDNSIYDLFIKPYEDGVFWELLAGRMAKRDLANQIGLQELFLQSGSQDLLSQELDLLEFYESEFEKHGLFRLKIDPKIQAPDFSHSEEDKEPALIQ